MARIRDIQDLEEKLERQIHGVKVTDSREKGSTVSLTGPNNEASLS